MPAAEHLCQGCRHQNRPAAQFCANCGADLSLAVMADAAQQTSIGVAKTHAAEREPSYDGSARSSPIRLFIFVFIVFALAASGVFWKAFRKPPQVIKLDHGDAVAVESHHHAYHGDHHVSVTESDDLADRWIRRIAQGAKDPYTVKQTVQRMLKFARRQSRDGESDLRFEARYEVPEANVHALEVALKSIHGELTFFYRDNRFTVEAAGDVHTVLRRVVSLLDGYTIMKQVRSDGDEY